MVTTTFNTYAHIKRLIQKGITEEAAEEIMDTISKSREIDFSNLVTKDHLEILKNYLENKISQSEGKISKQLEVKTSQLEAQISQLEARMLRWYINSAIAIAAVIVACKVF
jgi:DNA-binding transcriptional MerR regulator